MSFAEYLSLSRWDRQMLHKKLGDFIAASNEEADEGTGAAGMPRAVRREGLF